jgi:hypothetical protein
VGHDAPDPDPANDAATADTAADDARLLEMGDWIMVSWALQVAATLGVPDRMAAGTSRVPELADAVGCRPDALVRVLRLLAMYGVVTELEDGAYALTPLGERLRTDAPGSLRSWFVMNAPVYRTLMTAPLDSLRTGAPVFEQVMGSSFFDYATADPAWGEAFDEAMGAVTRGTAAAIVDADTFDGIGRLVDVGGGNGTLLAAILRAHPGMRGVVVDLAPVIERARPGIAASDVADRLELVAGDFFESRLPVGDAYLLSWIIHDWDDAAAGRILANCRRAIGEAGRLLLVEAVVPPGDVPHFSRTLDIVMLVALGGRERTAGEYRALLRDAGFELMAIHETASPMSVLEARPAG